jgi:threonyl-tRNA synthetase
MKSLKVTEYFMFWLFRFENFTAQISLRDKENKESTMELRKQRAIINAAADKGLSTVIEYGEAAFMVQSWISW